MSIISPTHRYPTRFREKMREKAREEAIRSFKNRHDSILMLMGYPPDLIPYEAFHRFTGLSPAVSFPNGSSYYTQSLTTWIHIYGRATPSFQEGWARHLERFKLFRAICLKKTKTDVAGIQFGLYYPSYCQWIADGKCPAGLNRYQRICRFIEEKRQMFF